MPGGCGAKWRCAATGSKRNATICAIGRRSGEATIFTGTDPRRPAREILAPLLLLAAVLCGCRDTGGPGDYFEISGRLFSFNYRVATAVYVVTLRLLRPMRQGQMVVATFENPAGGAPIVVEQKVWPNLDKVTIESPPLECVVKDRPYVVSLVVRNDTGEALQKLETTVTSDRKSVV